MFKISACLVVRNEEKSIERCLKSLTGEVDEIIVVHDGECSDKTLDICRKYTDKIFVRPFEGVMERHLPWSFSSAKGSWILRIDPDEYLSDRLKTRLRNLSETAEVSAYSFLWPLWDGERYRTVNWPRKVALFRKDRISFLGAVHSPVLVSGKIIQTDLRLEHQPFYNNFSWKVFKKKWISWARVQTKEILSDINDIPSFGNKRKKWPFSFRLRKYLSLFLIPVDFLVPLIKVIPVVFKEKTLFVFKYALFVSLFRVYVDIGILKSGMSTIFKSLKK